MEIKNKLNRDYLTYKTGNKKKDKHMILKNLKQKDLLEKKFITIIYHQLMHLRANKIERWYWYI